MTNTTSSAIACSLTAIKTEQRPRYDELMKRLRNSVQLRNDLDYGYTLQLDCAAITLPEVAEWMSMERLCCPFLSLQLSAAGNRESWVLTLTGPEGVKHLLQQEFPNR